MMTLNSADDIRIGLEHFEEIRTQDAPEREQTKWTQALVVSIDPRQCSKVVKLLSKPLPLDYKCGNEEGMMDLSHLKRVRKPNYSTTAKKKKKKKRGSGKDGKLVSAPIIAATAAAAVTAATDDAIEERPVTIDAKEPATAMAAVPTSATLRHDEPKPKRPKLQSQLQILICAQSTQRIINAAVGDDSSEPDSDDIQSPIAVKSLLEMLQKEHGEFEVATVPGRPPQSQQEFEEFNAAWPTSYYPLQSVEHREKQLQLTQDDLTTMRHGVSKVMERLASSRGAPCAVVIDPNSNHIVASSWDEATRQGDITTLNPLATPILMALQGVSRAERDATARHRTDLQLGNPPLATSAVSADPRYLCNGYDLCTSYEPAVFEAMSCVHFRLRRMIFIENGRMPRRFAWGQGCSKHSVHCLPGTNHSYRVFRFANPTACANSDEDSGGGSSDVAGQHHRQATAQASAQ